MTGTLVAKHSKETWPEKSVVVLEAREFCSGATGRNAGHCKPDQWRGFAAYEKAFGTEQALKVYRCPFPCGVANEALRSFKTSKIRGPPW
jgi:glycine/D-amino acid oxidase-like deaminating enzyme